MKYFHYLTENAYVQTGVYRVNKFYKPGQHYLPGVGGVLPSKDVEVATSFPHTAAASGLYRISFTAAGGVSGNKVTVSVDGVNVHSVYVAASGSERVETVQWVDNTKVIAVSATGSAPTSVSIVRTPDKPFPYFSADWAAFSTPTDGVDKGYDPASYGIGVKASHQVVDVPVVKRVSLLYFVSNNSTQEQKTLVQYDGDLAALKSAGLVASDNSRVVWTEEEYIKKFAPKGFNRFGRVLPKGVEVSRVDELSSFTARYTGADGVVTDNVTAYFERIYMHNERPLFDEIYMVSGFAGDFAGGWTDVPGHFLRWLGGAPSENIAPINRPLKALSRDGYLYDTAGKQIKTPDDAVTKDSGIEYTGADEYNIRNFRRY